MYVYENRTCISTCNMFIDGYFCRPACPADKFTNGTSNVCVSCLITQILDPTTK